MVCFETKEANAAIHNQDKIHTNKAKEKEQKSNQMNMQPTQLNAQIDQKKIKSKELKI